MEITDDKKMEQVLTEAKYGKAMAYGEDGTPLYFDKNGLMIRSVNNEMEEHVKNLKN